MIIHELSFDDPIDLDVLASTLRQLFAGQPPVGAEIGLERLIRAVALLVRCGNHTAEKLVAALVFRRQLVMYADSSGREVWRFRDPPARC